MYVYVYTYIYIHYSLAYLYCEMPSSQLTKKCQHTLII